MKFSLFFTQKALKIFTNKSDISPQAVFCKFKEMFYVFHKVAVKRITNRSSLKFVVITVLFPCFIILIIVNSTQVRAEVKISSITGFINITQDVVVNHKVSTDINNGLVKLPSKFSARTNKFFSPVSTNYQTVADEVSDKKGCQRECWMCNDTYKKFAHKPDPYFTLTGLLIIIGCLIIGKILHP